jgi:hypothetical protein
MAALALYLFGAFRLPHDVPTPRRAVSGRFACAALLSALYFSRGLGGRTIDSWTESFLPPTGYGGATGATPELIAWGNDLAAGKLAAKAQGKLVFLDFTGVTCTNCRKVEKTIFVDRSFADALASKAVPVRLYTDRQSPDEVKAGDEANRKLMEQLGSVTLPRTCSCRPGGRCALGYDPTPVQASSTSWRCRTMTAKRSRRPRSRPRPASRRAAPRSAPARAQAAVRRLLEAVGEDPRAGHLNPPNCVAPSGILSGRLADPAGT